MKTLISLFLLLTLGSVAHASAPRTLVADTIQNSALSTSFTLPGTSDQLAGQTVPNGGTGAASFTSHGMIFGSGTAALGVTAAGSQFQVFQAGASGVPTVGALNLAQSAAVTGILPAVNGGSGVASPTAGGVLVGAGSSPVSVVTCSTSGNVLTWGGSSWSCSAPSTGAPSLNGGSSSPLGVVASTGVTLTSIGYMNQITVLGASGPVTVTATPSITAGTADGQRLIVVGAHTTAATAQVTLQDAANLSGSGLSLNGNIVLGSDSTLELQWNALAGLWIEIARR